MIFQKFLIECVETMKGDKKMTNGEFCNANCRHFREDYELVGDEEVNMTVCALGHTEIYNRAFCEDYQV